MLTARNLRAPLHWTVAGLSVLDIAVALILSAGLVAGIIGALPFSHGSRQRRGRRGALLMTAAARLAPQGTAGHGRRPGRRCPAQRADLRPDGPLRRRPARGVHGGLHRRNDQEPGQVGRRAGALRRRGGGRRPLRSADRGPGAGLRAGAACRVLRGRLPGRRQDQDRRGAAAALGGTARPAGADGTPGGPRRPGQDERGPRGRPARTDRRHRRHRGRRARRAHGGRTTGLPRPPAMPRPGRPWPRSSTMAGPCSVTSGRFSVPCGSAHPASRSRRWPACPGCSPGPPAADARLTVDGNPRTLPAGLELSGYRIVEHLLQALADAPGAAVDVRLHFGPDALELHVSGPPVTERRRAGRAGGRAGTRPPARRHRG